MANAKKTRAERSKVTSDVITVLEYDSDDFQVGLTVKNAGTPLAVSQLIFRLNGVAIAICLDRSDNYRIAEGLTRSIGIMDGVPA